MKSQDTYKEVKVIQFPDMIARVYIPDLTPEERNKRMQTIQKRTMDLMKKVK